MQAETLFWEKRPNGRVRCFLCPRRCSLAEGQRGFCFVRQNINGRLRLTAYGLPSGFCVDPIEKKPLNHFYPGSRVLSFGTVGCNLGCKFCQNWVISKARTMDVSRQTVGPSDIARLAVRHQCEGVAYTYNDPVIFAEYAVDTAKASHAEGLWNVAVTAGFISPEARPYFFSAMDAANIDLKGFSEEFYRKYTLSSLKPVLDTLKYVYHQTRVWLEITTLIIPGLNDHPLEMDRMTQWIVRELGDDVPLHLTAFHPDFRMRGVPPTPVSTLRSLRRRALENGLKYVYLGNVCDQEGATTYCGRCGEVLIQRQGYRIVVYHLREGNRCPGCGEVCSGVFEGMMTPGQMN